MRTTAAVLHAPRHPLVVEELELEAPRRGEVLVRVAASGVCHSCLSWADGSWEGAVTPVVLGDEGAGVVERVGPEVDRLKPGDHVILSWAPTCGRCRWCARGRPLFCDRRSKTWWMEDGTTRMRLNGQVVHHYAVSSYAAHTVVAESCAIKVDPDLPLDKLALIGCSVMTGAGAVLNTARARPGDSVAVFGCGGIDLNAVQGAHLAGAHPIVAVDLAENKLEAARALGATHAVHAQHERPSEAIWGITGAGVDYAIVAVGSIPAMEEAWASLGLGGTCVVVGVPGGDQRLALDVRRTLVGQERRLVGSSYGSAQPLEDFPRFVALYRAGKLKLDELITRTYSIYEANEAFRDLATGAVLRGLIVY